MIDDSNKIKGSLKAVHAKELAKEMLMASMKKGGKVKKTGLYRLHKGETVVPAGKNEVESFRRNHLGHK